MFPTATAAIIRVYICSKRNLGKRIESALIIDQTQTSHYASFIQIFITDKMFLFSFFVN